VAGRFDCAAGATSAVGQSASADCSDLLEGYYYTGLGDISDNTVVQCPDDHFCDGTPTISVATDGVAQGLTACPTGSGTVGLWSATARDSINDCRKVYPGYYWDAAAAACPAILNTATECGFRLCDDTTPADRSFCTGDVIPAGTLPTDDVGRTACVTYWTTAPRNEPTRTTCNVLAAGEDCTAADHCIS
jgi:hypothetical protein